MVSDEVAAQGMEQALLERQEAPAFPPEPAKNSGSNWWDTYSRKHKLKRQAGKSFIPPHKKRR